MTNKKKPRIFYIYISFEEVLPDREEIQQIEILNMKLLVKEESYRNKVEELVKQGFEEMDDYLRDD